MQVDMEVQRADIRKSAAKHSWATFATRLFVLSSACLSFCLAILSYVFFPAFARAVVVDLFGYAPTASGSSHVLWTGAVLFYYSYYTFLSIGLGSFLLFISLLWQVARGRTGPRGAGYQMAVDSQEQPSISVIIPAHNEEENLAGAIRSVMNQRIAVEQIIVVDDGSDDGTGRVAREFGVEVVVHDNCKGKGEAVRSGLKRARSQLVAILDADSRLFPDALEKLFPYVRDDAVGGATGFVDPTAGEENLVVRLQQLEYANGFVLQRQAQSLTGSVAIIPGPIGLWRRELLQEIVEEEGIKTITEDFELTLELHRRGYKIYYEPGARASTVAPNDIRSLWRQRKRWYLGGLDVLVKVHRRLLVSGRWISGWLVHNLLLGYFGSLVELSSIAAIVPLYLSAPDRVAFLLNLPVYAAYGFLIGLLVQMVVVKTAYRRFNHNRLLYYVPLYVFLREFNCVARLAAAIMYHRSKREWGFKTKRAAARVSAVPLASS